MTTSSSIYDLINILIIDTQYQKRGTSPNFDLQQRHEKVIGKCGPGIEKERGFGGITLEGRAGGWDTYQPSIGPSFGPSFGSPFGPVDQGSDSDFGAGFPLSGQATADQFGMGFDGASFGYGFTGGSPFFGQSGAVGLGGNFDPLGARDFAESYRKRRFAENEKMTKGKIKKSIQRLNKSFEPMETFLDTQLENCSQTRVSRLKAKVNKAKGRIEKVLKRQGETLLQKQRKRRKN